MAQSVCVIVSAVDRERLEAIVADRNQRQKSQVLAARMKADKLAVPVVLSRALHRLDARVAARFCRRLSSIRKLIQVSAWLTGIWDTFKPYLAASRGTRRAMTSKGIVHVVDDDEPLRRAMARLLRTAGFETVAYETAQAVLNAAPNLSSGCRLLDLRMPGMDGFSPAGWRSK